jgi:hypothetical protein
VFAAIAVAASGAGVAAAVTLPSNGPSPAERARIVEKMDEGARSEAPSALLSRLGLPQTLGTTEARGLVLARAADGSIVLLPAAVVADRARAAAAGANGLPGAVAEAPGGGQAPNGPVGNGETGASQGGAGGSEPGVPGGTTGDQGGTTAGGSQTGTPTATNHGKKPAAVTKGGKKPAAPPTSTPTTDVVDPDTTLTTTTPTPSARTTGAVEPRTTGGTGSSGSTGSPAPAPSGETSGTD